MDITYQQILAEQYDENSKMLLIQQEQEYDYELVIPSHAHMYDENEIENPEEFNKFAGDRNKPEHVIKPPPNPDSKHRDNVRVLNQIINIDTRFRGNIVPINQLLCNGQQSESSLVTGTSSSWFVYAPERPYKNVKNVKITTLEFPNTFYTFSSSTRNNTIFSVQTVGEPANMPIIIDDGNYTISQLVTDIQALLPVGYTITLGTRTNKITIAGPSVFTLSFPSTPNINPNGNGIGYNLGFLQTIYANSTSYTAETMPDTVQDNYVYVVINDYNLIKHPIYGGTSIQAFGKITLQTAKNTVVFDNNFSNSSSKIYYFQQPTNITKFEIKFIDGYGNVIDLNGANVSITLELEEVLDSAVYENMLML